MSGWQTALDKKIDVIDWVVTDGEKYVNGFAHSLASEAAKKKAGSQGNAESFLAAVHGLPDHLRRAVPIYVHPDILDIAEHAAETFAMEPLRETDLITPWAFVSLPRTVFFADANGKMTGFSKMSWHPLHVQDPDTGVQRHGISIVLYATNEDWEHDDWAAELHDLKERLTKKGIDPDRHFRISINHAMPWFFDQPLPEQLLNKDPGTAWNVLVQVLMRLMMQQITRHTYENVDRPGWRRAKRANLDDRKVLVVKLRRTTAHHEHRETDVEWSHRWMVEGHWRNQWYPSLGTHRQIWIADHVKGPEDKPLRLHAGRAMELIR